LQFWCSLGGDNAGYANLRTGGGRRAARCMMGAGGRGRVLGLVFHLYILEREFWPELG